MQLFLSTGIEEEADPGLYKEVTLFIWVWVQEKLDQSSTCDPILCFLYSFVLNNFKGQLGRAPKPHGEQLLTCCLRSLKTQLGSHFSPGHMRQTCCNLFGEKGEGQGVDESCVGWSRL